MDKQKQTITGAMLRACRTKCGLSQQQVANALGINRTTYTYYESGRSEPNLKTIVRLAQIFCVEVSDLLPNESTDSALGDSITDTPNPIYSLTKDEQNLILHYRLLSDDDKMAVLDKITNKLKSEN